MSGIAIAWVVYVAGAFGFTTWVASEDPGDLAWLVVSAALGLLWPVSAVLAILLVPSKLVHWAMTRKARRTVRPPFCIDDPGGPLSDLWGKR